MIDDFTSLLVVAAHPDDEVLGCGGLIKKCTMKNIPVRVIFLAEGSSVRFSSDECDSDIDIAIKKRQLSANRALDLLGVSKENIFFSNRKCCQMDTYPLLDVTRNIESHINEFKPSCILTHSMNDTNIDHRVAYQATLPSIRPVRDNSIKLVLSFEVLSSTEWNYPSQFEPNYFIDISEILDDKINASLKYEGEIFEDNHPRSSTTIKALACYRGSQSGYKYAEAFKLIVKR